MARQDRHQPHLPGGAAAASSSAAVSGEQHVAGHCRYLVRAAKRQPAIQRIELVGAARMLAVRYEHSTEEEKPVCLRRGGPKGPKALKREAEKAKEAAAAAQAASAEREEEAPAAEDDDEAGEKALRASFCRGCRRGLSVSASPRNTLRLQSGRRGLKSGLPWS